jgi:phosphoserine phosphatase RsbU/P
MHFIKCSEIWGGIYSADENIKTKGLTASMYCKPFESNEGGDIYYFSVCGKDILTRIAIGDVAGHGESVSKASSQLYDSLSRNMNKPDGKEILVELNEEISKETKKAITTAGIYTINNDASTLSFSTAGHPPFFMKRKDTNEWREVMLQNHTPKGNIPLGTLQGTHFDEESLSVGPGDRFFFLTDGVLEASNEKGNMFGKIELLKVFKQNMNSSLEKLKHAVLNALKEHVGKGVIHDDLTFLTMEIN